MEDNTKLQDLQLEQESDDTLSLSDLPLHDNESEPNSPPQKNPKSLTYQNSFTFSIDPNHDQVVTDTIIFYGKPIHHQKPSKSQSKEVQLHDLVFMRYESFNKRQALHSLEFTSPKRLPATRSGGSRKHSGLFGLAKIEPGMELRDIRERQSRRTPKPMFPVVGGGEPAIAAGNRGGGRRHWGLFRVRAFACFTHV